jgi:AraC family ethanolamine operon transcriptional activator
MANAWCAIPFRQSENGSQDIYVKLPKDSMQTACQPIMVHSAPLNDISLMNGPGVFFGDIDAQVYLHSVEQGAANKLRAFGVTLLKSRAHASTALDTAAQGDHVRDALLEKLLAVLNEPRRTAGQRCSDPACPPLEARALDLIMTRLDQPPSVAELCNLLGVSRRTLQNCIQATWGMGPLAWVNTLRLNAVRSRLKTAKSVTEAATEFGFWHFGHFSTAYHTLFGEPPSSTLGRHRRRRAM